MTESNPVPETDVESNPHRQLSPETEFVERTDIGVSLTVKLTRGTGTRDQDKITAKVKAKTLDEAREDMETLRAYVNDLAADVRQIQPDTEASSIRGGRFLPAISIRISSCTNPTSVPE